MVGQIKSKTINQMARSQPSDQFKGIGTLTMDHIPLLFLPSSGGRPSPREQRGRGITRPVPNLLKQRDICCSEDQTGG